MSNNEIPFILTQLEKNLLFTLLSVAGLDMLDF